MLANAYDAEKKEFIASSDRNFRPVHMATGPDGCLYIVDMYRGIIQEGAWVKGFLRERVLEAGLDKNVGRGRIWRVVSDATKKTAAPRLLDETPAQLVAHLSHPNGWWRDTAQKLLVLKRDAAVSPALLEKTKAAKVAPDLFAAYLKNSTARLNGVKDAALSKGAVIYQSLCFSCHAPDGKGVDTGAGKMAPPLAGSAIANGDKTAMIKILLHGLTGPIDGQTYVGQMMVPMKQESDDWIADVLTEVRKSWGNTGDAVTPAEVAKVRAETGGVKDPYTMEKLLGK